ncbi:MAG TPA: CAP domain-containing protein [Solirubrobacterales bacterium]
MAKLGACALATALALVVLGAALLPSASLAGGVSCGHATTPPARLSLHQMRNSELCLINRARTHFGLVPLRYNADLRDSATGHSDSMVAHGYFSHEGPGGSVDSRISRTGYIDKGVQAFTIGENIAAGAGHDGSPWEIFEEWMHSPPHRENILDPSFHDAGVGVSRGVPFGRAGAAATYTVDFGARRH